VLLAEFAQGFLLDLTHPLPRQTETLADFFECQWALVTDAEVDTLMARKPGLDRLLLATDAAGVVLWGIVSVPICWRNKLSRWASSRNGASVETIIQNR